MLYSPDTNDTVIAVPDEQSHSVGPAWFVVETLFRKEALAVQNLERQHLPCFFPRFWKARRHARRIDTILSPLFPGYVFARFDPDAYPWSRINGTFGVKRLVAPEHTRPLPMPHRELDFIQRRCADGIMERLIEHPEPGQQARFVTGPFAGQLATIERLDGRGRVRLLMEILGAAHPVGARLASVGPA